MGVVTSNSHEYAELEPAPEHFEEGVTITVETLIEIDLGDASQKQPTFIGSGLSENEKYNLTALLKNYKDCFAWSHDQMRGLSSKVACISCLLMMILNLFNNLKENIILP